MRPSRCEQDPSWRGSADGAMPLGWPVNAFQSRATWTAGSDWCHAGLDICSDTVDLITEHGRMDWWMERWMDDRTNNYRHFLPHHLQLLPGSFQSASILYLINFLKFVGPKPRLYISLHLNFLILPWFTGKRGQRWRFSCFSSHMLPGGRKRLQGVWVATWPLWHNYWTRKLHLEPSISPTKRNYLFCSSA